MEYSKDTFVKAVNDFCGMDSGNRNFTEAYSKNEPYYFKRHKTLIVPTEIINTYFGCPLYRMNAEIVDFLHKNGAKRVHRQIYENGKQTSSVQVWVFTV